MQNLMQNLNYGKVHVFHDAPLNFTAIIAIHSLKNGTSLGGCRCLPYNSFEQALTDALNLGHAMTQKSKMHNLNYGGGKSVIMYPEKTQQRAEIFKKFGHYINSLNGEYIAAEDSGSSQQDMENIAETSNFVLATSILKNNNVNCNPSKYTAQGVLQAILGANQYIFGNQSLANKSFIIQGLGAVGMLLAQQIFNLGGKLYINDTDEERIKLASQQFSAICINEQQLASTPADYFVPCALGGVLTKKLCQNIQTKFIIGAANNQFTTPLEHIKILQQRNIHWIPDFLCNGGGLIHVNQQYGNLDENFIELKILAIKQKTINILTKLNKHKIPMDQAINEIIREQ